MQYCTGLYCTVQYCMSEHTLFVWDYYSTHWKYWKYSTVWRILSHGYDKFDDHTEVLEDDINDIAGVQMTWKEGVYTRAFYNCTVRIENIRGLLNV